MKRSAFALSLLVVLTACSEMEISEQELSSMRIRHVQKVEARVAYDAAQAVLLREGYFLEQANADAGLLVGGSRQKTYDDVAIAANTLGLVANVLSLFSGSASGSVAPIKDTTVTTRRVSFSSLRAGDGVDLSLMLQNAEDDEAMLNNENAAEYERLFRLIQAEIAVRQPASANLASGL